MKIPNNFILNILPFLMCILLGILCSSCSLNNQSTHGKGKPSMPSEIGVEAYTITPQKALKTISCTGEFISPQSTVLTSEIMGVISFLDIPEGKEVKSGYVIAKIEDSVSIAELNAEEAKSENAEEDYKRIKNLYNEGAISKQLYDNAFEDYKISKAQLERAKSIQSKNIIKAPFNGILSLKKISLGSYVNPGDEIVRITQISPLNLTFSIPEKYLHELDIGQKINFTISTSDNANKKMTTSITAIDPNIDGTTRTIKAQAQVNNYNLDLLPGGFSNVEIEVNNNVNNVLIPEEAIVNDGQEKIVYVITPLNNALPRKIDVAKWEDGYAEISSGLRVGEKVITSGHQKLFPGVMVIDSDYVPINNIFLEHGHPE